jgi:predicted anti-sigma-YlaC factor YlaD
MCEVLEDYALQHLHEEEIASLEEHLLYCEPCRNRLDVVEERIQLLRTALWQAEAEQRITGPKRQGILLAFPYIPKG